MFRRVAPLHPRRRAGPELAARKIPGVGAVSGGGSFLDASPPFGAEALLGVGCREFGDGARTQESNVPCDNGVENAKGGPCSSGGSC